VKRILAVLLGLVLLTGAIALANTPVTPRVYDDVLMFDNETGADAVKLAIIFDTELTFDASAIIVVGGGMPEMVAISTTFAFIDVPVDQGGTLQLTLPAEYAAAVVSNAFWF